MEAIGTEVSESKTWVSDCDGVPPYVGDAQLNRPLNLEFPGFVDDNRDARVKKASTAPRAALAGSVGDVSRVRLSIKLARQLIDANIPTAPPARPAASRKSGGKRR